VTKVNFEKYDLQLSSVGDGKIIYDVIRRKNILLTPEELVRQTLVHYLISNQQIGKSLIAVERGLDMPQGKKRFDIVVFDRCGNPFLIVECKSPDINIDMDTFLQGTNYNTALKAKYLWLSNGKTNFFFRLNDLNLLDEIPELANEL
jgi:hypothetical protein